MNKQAGFGDWVGNKLESALFGAVDAYSNISEGYQKAKDFTGDAANKGFESYQKAKDFTGDATQKINEIYGDYQKGKQKAYDTYNWVKTEGPNVAKRGLILGGGVLTGAYLLKKISESVAQAHKVKQQTKRITKNVLNDVRPVLKSDIVNPLNSSINTGFSNLGGILNSNNESLLGAVNNLSHGHNQIADNLTSIQQSLNVHNTGLINNLSHGYNQIADNLTSIQQHLMNQASENKKRYETGLALALGSGSALAVGSALPVISGALFNNHKRNEREK